MLVLAIALVLASCGSTVKHPKLGPYKKAAEEATASQGDGANYKELGDELKNSMLATLERLEGRVKLTEGVMSATGAVTTASGAAATATTKIVDTDETKKLIGYISSITATAVGGIQMVVSKIDAAVEYTEACKEIAKDWDVSKTKDKAAYERLVMRAAALKRKYKHFAEGYTTPIDDKADKKVKMKELMGS